MRIGTRLAWREDKFEHEDRTAIGDRIRTLLEESESVETVAELSQRAELSPSVMQRILSGDIAAPGRPVLVKIANALDVDVDTLIELIDDDALEGRGEGFLQEPEGRER